MVEDLESELLKGLKLCVASSISFATIDIRNIETMTQCINKMGNDNDYRSNTTKFNFTIKQFYLIKEDALFRIRTNIIKVRIINVNKYL